jgi:uncharacterized phage protein (TIGR01671 family)
MKRQIKFRGKRIDNREFIEGNLIQRGNKYFIIPIKDSDELEGDQVRPETVGQFTGLLDKNGRDVFEGDILKTDTQMEFIIEAINGGLQMYHSRYKGEKYNELIAEPTCNPQTASYINQCCEVIGNIHDNPIEP